MGLYVGFGDGKLLNPKRTSFCYLEYHAGWGGTSLTRLTRRSSRVCLLLLSFICSRLGKTGLSADIRNGYSLAMLSGVGRFVSSLHFPVVISHQFVLTKSSPAGISNRCWCRRLVITLFISSHIACLWSQRSVGRIKFIWNDFNPFCLQGTKGRVIRWYQSLALLRHCKDRMIITATLNYYSHRATRES
jgi:hypothetical protein